MRSPYFLSLLVEQVEAAGGIPRGRAGLFTGFVRRTLRREVERDNPLFAPDSLLTERDVPADRARQVVRSVGASREGSADPEAVGAGLRDAGAKQLWRLLAGPGRLRRGP